MLVIFTLKYTVKLSIKYLLCDNSVGHVMVSGDNTSFHSFSGLVLFLTVILWLIYDKKFWRLCFQILAMLNSLLHFSFFTLSQFTGYCTCPRLLIMPQVAVYDQVTIHAPRLPYIHQVIIHAPGYHTCPRLPYMSQVTMHAPGYHTCPKLPYIPQVTINAPGCHTFPRLPYMPFGGRDCHGSTEVSRAEKITHSMIGLGTFDRTACKCPMPCTHHQWVWSKDTTWLNNASLIKVMAE